MATLLQVSPAVIRRNKGQLELDVQTCSDMSIWLTSFDRIIIACPSFPESLNEQDGNSKTVGESLLTKPVNGLPFEDRLELVELPFAYKLKDFIRVYHSTRKLLREKIIDSDYLYFGFSGLIGDWGAVACLEAKKLGRSYSITAANVHHEKHRLSFQRKPLFVRLYKENVTLPIMKRYHQNLIKNSALGLFQGQDCYTEYSVYSNNPHCVYLVRTTRQDQISENQINQKIDEILMGCSLNICYVGRIADMKGPFDWIDAICALSMKKVNFHAVWVGEGPLSEEVEAYAKRLDVLKHIKFLGFIDDQKVVLELIKKSHIFMFCHKTPESPRCLIEALVCGCPIVGYGSPYSKDLINENGGGVLVPINDWETLAQKIFELDKDRSKLSDLIKSAAMSGQRFSQESVFEHRISLIKEHLSPKEAFSKDI